jgi:hypothetical protein
MVLLCVHMQQTSASVTNNGSSINHTYAMPAAAAEKYEATKTRLLGE